VSLDELREIFELADSRLWLLLALCIATGLHIQSVGNSDRRARWPHQRRPARMAPQARAAGSAWSCLVAAAAGLLLAIVNLAW
jgi:hypothetical protein